jgi:hypothetical protein
MNLALEILNLNLLYNKKGKFNMAELTDWLIFGKV